MDRKLVVALIVLVILAVVVGVIWLKDYNNRPPAITNVDSTGLVNAQKDGAQVLDVRTATEYMDGHIPGALLVEEGTYASALADAPRDAAYVVYCRTGNRSTTVVNWMQENGFTRIYHLNEGIVNWRGGLIQGIEPGEPDYSLPWLAEADSPQGPSDVSDIALLAPTDDRAVMVQFSTRN